MVFNETTTWCQGAAVVSDGDHLGILVELSDLTGQCSTMWCEGALVVSGGDHIGILVGYRKKQLNQSLSFYVCLSSGKFLCLFLVSVLFCFWLSVRVQSIPCEDLVSRMCHVGY